MTNDFLDHTLELPDALQNIYEQAQAQGLNYAGGVSPQLAWELLSRGKAQLVDVRSPEERKFVGHIPGTLNIPWASGTALTKNPRFKKELEAKVNHELPILLLCRSGKRSVLAAIQLAGANVPPVFNVLEGFEGDHNDLQQRGFVNGWRIAGLPWIQD